MRIPLRTPPPVSARSVLSPAAAAYRCSNIAYARFSSSASVPSPATTIPTRSTGVHGLPRTVASLIHPKTDAGAVLDRDGDEVIVHGWIKSIRKMKNVSFAHIIDGSTSVPVQAVLTKMQSEGLSIGSSIQVAGKWMPSNGRQQNEIHAEKVRLLGDADPATYPLQKKYQTREYLRTLTHLRPRLPHYTALLQMRSFVTQNLTNFFANKEFVQCYPPIITSSDCEGAGEVFTVVSAEKGTDHFFRSPKYLTVSTQLHLEALAGAMPRVWTLSPTFRAEKSDTNRHLSEFYMLEAELSFIETLEPLQDLIESMIRQLVLALQNSRIGKEILEGASEEAGLEARWEGLLKGDRWARLTYSEVIKVLENEVAQGRVEFEFPTQWGVSLQSEHEKYLAKLYGGPVFVTDYPSDIKPFYMLPSSSRSPEGKTVACFDLLLPSVGELIGGSLREHRLDELVESMKTHGLIPADGTPDDAGLQWYTDLRKYGSVPHGGFGMGMDRLLCYLTGEKNLREVVAFPRWVGRCDA